MKAPYDIALLVYGCDRYEFLFKGFYHFFSRNGAFDLPCNFYFATEEKKVSLAGFTNILSGKGEWTSRLKFLLDSQIKENYVLLFQEDMWLNRAVNPAFFDQLFELAKASRWNLVKLHSSDNYRTTAGTHFVEGFNISKVDNVQSNYLMSHQVSLWDKRFLISQLQEAEHPWKHERAGSKRLKKLNPEIFQVDYFAENGNVEVNANRNPVGRSEYYTISVNGVLDHYALPYIRELEKEGGEDLRKYAAELQHHYDLVLTHDGKTKPRREDVIQVVKRWWRGGR